MRMSLRLLASSSLLLVACKPALRFVPDTLPGAMVGQPYHATIQISRNETPVGNISAAALPPGLTLTFDKAHEIASLDGTPTAAGRTSITVEAWCYGTNFAGQTASHVYELVVRAMGQESNR